MLTTPRSETSYMPPCCEVIDFQLKGIIAEGNISTQSKKDNDW